MKKYVDIERLKVKYTEMFDIGEHIIVESKIDGANASFTYDEETDCIAAFFCACTPSLNFRNQGILNRRNLLLEEFCNIFLYRLV